MPTIDDELKSSVRAHIGAARRQSGAASPKTFTQVYLEPLLNKPFSVMHEEIFEQLKPFHGRRGSHLAIAAPRGHAKSTIVTLAYVLWCLAYGKEQLIVVASGTAEQAKKLLSHVKVQIESNPLLQEDFPLLRKGHMRPWRQEGIRLGNGTMLVSCSSTQNLRGIRNGRHRPTLIIADDLEDKTHVVSEEQRQKISDWFGSTLLKTGTPDTNVIVVGTVLHHESLLAGLLDLSKSPGWRPMRYRALVKESGRPDLWDTWNAIMRSQLTYGGATGVDAAERFYEVNKSEMNREAQILWPEQYSLVDLMGTRLREGESTFQAEFQNEPLDHDLCIFSKAKIEFWDDRFHSVDALREHHGPGGRIYGACDPSLGNHAHKGDFSAIVLLYKAPRSEIKYVIAADIERRTPQETITRILHYADMYDISDFGVESNNFQQLMVDSLRRQARSNRLPLPIKEIHSRSCKSARIKALEAEISQGRLVFSRSHQTLMAQLRQFPVGRHDDGPDALEMAVSVTHTRGGVARMSMETGQVFWHSEHGSGPFPREWNQ